MKTKTYIDSVHFTGRIWMVATLALFIGMPAVVSMYYNVWAAPSDVLAGLSSVALLYYPTAVIEVLTYAPLVGTGGMYLSFVTGNISNLKLPCAISALQTANVDPQSEEGEVISTISIAISSIVVTLIIAVCVLLIGVSDVMSVLTDKTSVFSTAFTEVLPALFGALAASYFAKYLKLFFVPLAVVLLILAFSGSVAVGTLIPIGVVTALVTAHLMYKKGMLREKNRQV